MVYQAVKKEYCQSCGMPLRFDVEEYLGTNADHSRSDEYCYYCLKDGEYIVDIPMEQMIDIWIKYTDKYNEYSDTNYSPQELRVLLNKRLPTLRRWRQMQITQDVHYEIINKVKVYIDHNLQKDIQTEELCEIANLSLYHFRRVFRNITGENIGSYIQRIRLESIAHQLVSTHLSINDIVRHSHYLTKHSLAKAFRKHFGMSMSAYRAKYNDVTVKEIDLLFQPEIKKMDTQKAICYPVEQAFCKKEEYLAIWEKIIHYKNKHIKQQDAIQFISISLDNPSITSSEYCRFYLGILTSEGNKPRGKFSLQEIPAGLYAVFSHKGNYNSLPELYQTIYEKWLPRSGYIQRNTMSFEIYLNSPYNTELSELKTEIYFPIEKPL
ncbi:MAG: GyrI-like domain-containing protein [Dysgonomonas sp.]|nr:GyrI-like domain-containing protein [Dysgonomonas sp.]